MGFKGCTPADILQAIETQLVNGIPLTTAEPIYWLMEGEDPKGNPTGRRDILLCAKHNFNKKPQQTGGGRTALRLELLIEIRLRTQNILDRVGTSKDLLVDHWGQFYAGVFNAMETCFPTDDGTQQTGNALTIYGFRLDTNETPNPDHASPKWGQSVGIWRCEYLPKIQTTPVG